MSWTAFSAPPRAEAQVERAAAEAGDAAGARPALDEAQRRWIAEHPVVRVGVDPEFHPFEYLDEDGEHRGIAADYPAVLGPRLGLTFEVVPDLTWDEAVRRAEGGEIDLLPSVGRTERRARFLRYSAPYTRFQRVIVTRTDMPFLSGLADLEGVRVAVQTSSSHEGFLREHSSIEASECPTLEACVRAVSVGKVDALVGNIASMAYWIRRLKLTNLKVAGAASDEAHTLHFGVRADLPILAAILDEGLATMSPREHKEILDRWVVLSYEPKLDQSSAWRVGGVAALVIALLMAWLVSLRRQKLALERAHGEALAAEGRAREANAELEAMHRRLEERVEQRTTELLVAERRFQEAQKMEALGTLVGGVAHDFNNILQGILGAIFLVERDPSGENARGYLSEAATLGKRGADLIRQLLTVARTGTGSKARVDLGALLDELTPILRTTLPSIVTFERQVDGEPLFVEGNAAMLQQVMMNLVNNARDASLGQGQPRVRLTTRRVGADEPRPPSLGGVPLALIEVEDNGPGIEPEVVDRIFDPFFTTKPAGRGTGLGLAMAFGAVREHRGAIEVDTSPAKGTTLRVFIPLAADASVVEPDDEGEALQGEGETVLLVDDEPAVLANHAEILSRLGYRVLSAADGGEALALLEGRAREVSLVILDVLMPVLDGAAAGREIRRRWPHIRIAYLSAFDPDGDLPDRLRPPGDLALAKPCTPHELSRVIRRALKNAS